MISLALPISFATTPKKATITAARNIFLLVEIASPVLKK
jgi:hypothetical protein